MTSEGEPALDAAARERVVRDWAAALGTSAYVPFSRPEVEHLLRGLLDDLLEAAAEPFDAALAVDVGRRLVAAQFVGEASLSRSIEVLGRALLAGPAAAPDRVVALLGGLAGGYAEATRDRTLDQQETVKLALLKASRDAERELRFSDVKFRELFASSAVGIAISDLDGKLLEANQALGDILGRSAGELAGRSLYELIHPDEVAQLTTIYQEMVKRGIQRRRLEQQYRLLRVDEHAGETGDAPDDGDQDVAWVFLAVSLLHDADGRPAHVTMVDDVTQQHLLGERLNHQSLHDALTGLPNQQFFKTSLEKAVGRGGPVTLLTLDLDGLTVVNEGLGRAAGDTLLREVAARLLAVVDGERATVARLGPDEFAVLLEVGESTPDVATLATRINVKLAEPVFIDGSGVALSACIGAVEHPGSTARPADPAELLRAAETTLQRVKAGGTRQWAIFDPRRDADDRTRSRLAAAMPGAWEWGQIGVEYQPLVRLRDGAIVAVEARLRWDHGLRAAPPSLSHRTCLALAERTGLVLTLGEGLLDTACEQLAAWCRTAAAPRLHVELAPQQAQDPDLVATVRRALDAAGVPAERLQLGIPARALAGGSGTAGEEAAEEAAETVRALAGLGVVPVLVEYGGLADLGTLEDLPVRVVRVADELVGHVAPGPDDSAMARAIPELIALAHACGATVLVGDVDTAEQAAWWRAAGADLAQGRHLAPAVPAEDVIALLLDSPLPIDREG